MEYRTIFFDEMEYRTKPVTSVVCHDRGNFVNRINLSYISLCHEYATHKFNKNLILFGPTRDTYLLPLK